MSERTSSPTSQTSRDVLSLLWRVLASPTVAAVWLALLAVAVLIALFFSPQQPNPSAGAAEMARWTSQAQQRFGDWYDALFALGVLNVAGSPGLRLLLAWGALSLLVRLAEGAAQIVRVWRQPRVRQAVSFFQTASRVTEWHVSTRRSVMVETLARRLAWPAWLPWRRLRVGPRRQEADQASYLLQDWLAWRGAASWLLHLGLLCLLVGVALDARQGWRQEAVMLMPGQAVQLAGQPDVSLRLEGVQGAGALAQAVSRIALDGPAGTSLAGVVAMGQPYTARGVTVYQRDVGPLLWVSARDAGDDPGAPIPLADASAGQPPAEAVRLAFTESRAEQYLLMPDIRKVLRLVLYRQGESWHLGRDELQIQVYAGDTPEADGSLVGDGVVELSGIAYQFTWGQYAIFDVTRSSGQWLVRVGMGLALLGLAASLLVPAVRLWVRVTEEGEVCRIGLAGEMPSEPAWLAAWLASWRRRLGGDDADG